MIKCEALTRKCLVFCWKHDYNNDESITENSFMNTFSLDRLIYQRITAASPEIKMNELLDGEEVFRRRDGRHGELVLQGTRLQLVERCLADEYRLSVLDGLHRAH